MPIKSNVGPVVASGARYALFGAHATSGKKKAGFGNFAHLGSESKQRPPRDL